MKSIRFRGDLYIIYEVVLFVNTFFESFFKKFFWKGAKEPLKKHFSCFKILFPYLFFGVWECFLFFEKKIKLFFKKLLTFQKKCV